MRRRLARAGFVALGIVALLSLWLAAHHFTQVPPPIWRSDDLEPLPAPNDNGWTLLSQNRAALDRRGLHGLPLASLALSQQRLDIEFSPSGPAEESALSICKQAWSRPHLVDSCPPRIHATCPFVEAQTCFELLQADALKRYRRDERDAVRALEPIVFKAAQLARSARSGSSYLLATKCLRDTLELAALMSNGRVVEMDLTAARQVSPANAIIGEYLIVRAIADKLEAASPGGLTFSEADSQRQVDAAFQAAYDSARWTGPSNRSLWFSFNPSGRSAADRALMGSPLAAMRESEAAVHAAVNKLQDEER